MIRTALCATALLGLTFNAQASRADSLRLSIEEAVARATASNPDLRNDQHDVEVSEANVERNSAWLANNPYLSVGFSHGSGNFNGNPQTGAATSTSGSATNYFGFLSQEFELGGQRGLRLESARRSRDRQVWEGKNSAATVIAEVKTAFIHAQVNVQRVTVARRSVDIAADLVSQLEKENPSAGSERIEINAARVQEERTRLDLAEAEQARDDGFDTLRHLLAIPFTQDIELTGTTDSKPTPLPPLTDLVARAVRQRPDLVALRHAADSAEASLGLANRDRIPNVTLTGSFSHFDGVTYGGGDVGFPIPVFQTKAADIHEATAERSRVADQIQALEAQAEMEVRTAYRACVVAGKTLDSQNRTIVPLSEENAQISQRQFDRDEASASDLIGQQIDLLTARRAQLDAIEAFNTSRVELERVVGGSLTSPTESTPAQ